jgi:DNA-binding transcriptional LysR family regulator
VPLGEDFHYIGNLAWEIRLDRFTGMAVFAKVVEAASFAAAARYFDMSPAMVSKHIQTLEARLGARLLNRTTRRVSPTEVGQDYYERCLRILSDLEEAEQAAGDLQSAPRGLLRVTAPVSFGTHCLAPLIADYLKTYPDVAIDLSLDDPYVDLIEKRFDLAIRIGTLADSSLIARKLGMLGMVACASPAYLERNGTPAVPQDLIGHNCLVYNFASADSAWHFFDKDGRENVIRVSGRFLASNPDALCTLALKGVGIVLAPDRLVERDLAAGRLVHLLPDYRTQETTVQAVYPHSQSLSAKTRTFIDFLAAHFTITSRKHNGDGRSLHLQTAPALREVSDAA